MGINSLKQIVEQDIQSTKDYSEFMKREKEPMMLSVGEQHMEHLHFFNLGYRYAMEKIKEVMEKMDD